MDLNTSEETYRDLDKWIEKLNECKPLTEAEVKSLCELASFMNEFDSLINVLTVFRQRKCCLENRMFNLSNAL